MKKVKIMASHAIVDIRRVSKSYLRKRAVDQLNIEIEAAQIYGLLGPNGSGKTTTIRMMMGLVQPDEGMITICGYDVEAEPLEMKKRVGILPDADELVEDLSAWEFLQFIASLRSIPERMARHRAKEWLQLLQLYEQRNQPLHSFSHGMRKKVQLVSAILHSPELLILDEPTTGLDPDMVITLKQILKRLREKGTAIFLSTHHLDFAQDLCDQVCLLQRGCAVAQGDTDEVLHMSGARTLEEAYIRLTRAEDKGEQIDALLGYW
ncbi:ABC transporter ATP-binding protein [Mechercharimyces sp. CAU 1602]|uniref:ABC transporter ATP-binding protein n=1 Tax=Mechercharimyces sp. CAU 1602 TaxID=2973933 RepID=UPI00216163E4|nr:ABC transporter ATP-binding protein [Mechercharimyces sp. CAU 1602]MCS1350025.1 ABC transporter ATP-binding protein [Mechercharimyces sp. CAU 1602]